MQEEKPVLIRVFEWMDTHPVATMFVVWSLVIGFCYIVGDNPRVAAALEGRK